MPPSITACAPNMYREMSVARNSAAVAISLASPIRPTGICTSKARRRRTDFFLLCRQKTSDTVAFN